MLQQCFSGTHSWALSSSPLADYLNISLAPKLVVKPFVFKLSRLLNVVSYHIHTVRYDHVVLSPFVFRIVVLLPFARIIPVIYRLLQCIYLFLSQKPLVMISC